MSKLLSRGDDWNIAADYHTHRRYIQISIMTYIDVTHLSARPCGIIQDVGGAHHAEVGVDAVQLLPLVLQRAQGVGRRLTRFHGYLTTPPSLVFNATTLGCACRLIAASPVTTAFCIDTKTHCRSPDPELEEKSDAWCFACFVPRHLIPLGAVAMMPFTGCHVAICWQRDAD